MKKNLLLLAAALLLTLASCRQAADTSTPIQQLQGHRCLLLTADEQLWPEGDTLGVDNSYSLQWPADGLLTPDDERLMLLCAFGDSTSTSFQQAADKWLGNSWLYEDGLPILHKHPADTLPADRPYNYAKLQSQVTTDSNLLTFVFSQESSAAFAAHGLYSSRYVTLDLATRRIVRLNHLVDTAQLGEVIVRALQDLVVNQPTFNNLYDELRQAPSLPVPADFYIDSTRSTITLVYQLYDVSPYATGIQSVVLPIFWLSKHIPLTPYAKELFGPDAYLPQQ